MQTLSTVNDKPQIWPSLPLSEWRDTRDTLHMWMQVVGKVKFALSPFLNEWWEVALAVTSRGLTTSTIPWAGGVFEVNFDFIDHNLWIVTSEGHTKALPLIPRSVADFYAEVMGVLGSLGIDVSINSKPVEVENGIPFEQDHVHASYDPEYVNRFWRILVQTEKVLERYRSPFVGKSSPIQFWWGSFDLSETRFSGRPAPERQWPKGYRWMRFSADQEDAACGFWPGDDRLPEPVFYAYTSPAPPGYEQAAVQPDAAYYDAKLGEYVLRYEDAFRTAAPEQTILEFFESAYDVGATLAGWDRASLERTPSKGV
jgi:Family of unknown function (DUF5996)